MEADAAPRPPSVDALARSLAPSGLPHAICVDIARRAIDEHDVESAPERAAAFARTLLSPVVNATGVLLHTNLGRAPYAYSQSAAARTVEFDLATGRRGSRQTGVGGLFALLCGGEDAMVVNNNAAAVLLVVAALADGREVPVSRGESVEIGGAFRVPDVIEQSGARLVDVGTTNRTRAADYERAIARPDADAAMILKVHPSNYRVEGFVEEAPIEALAAVAGRHGIPLVADIGSGLIDANCPWLPGAPPAWLAGEPAAVQSLAGGADLVTFSGDKLLGGPQAGIIVGRADLIERCKQHPLARALRPGALVIGALQELAVVYLRKEAATGVPFWRMVAEPVGALRTRAEAVVDSTRDVLGPGAEVVAMEAMPGAGSAPGVTMPSFGIAVPGDHLDALRRHDPPVIARTRDDLTLLDLRSVDPVDDVVVAAALRASGTT
jgi:L-seryl-tRNA(Ser) seleniumtransferase